MSNPYPGQNPPPPYGYPVPPQPPKKNNVGKIIGIGCGGLIGLSVLLAACGALMAGGDAVKDGGGKSGKAAAAPPAADPAVRAEDPAPVKSAAPGPAKKADVELTASAAEFKPTVFSQGSDFTSVRVTVTNNGDAEVSVNVLSFEVTAQDGTRKNTELAAAEDQIDTVQLAKGEKVTGTITVKGKLRAKTVYFKNGLLGTTYSAPVG
ncbi:DUF4352 domain-containing protein [Streptomyces sp. NPDC002033]|uniref:DUF4352 domain-containing protein n=1 Tax=unclassified Streptomyces TaxID=2593676 RepID=UPI0033186694